MAITIESSNNNIVTLEEYLDFMHRHVDVSDPDSLASSAAMFKGVLNNKSLLTDRLNKELASARDYQGNNTYSAHVMLLELNEKFIVRANVWEPVRKYQQEWLTDDEAFSYLYVHDHNFTFMTGGYLGVGYETTIWEWDGLELVPEAGQQVELRFLEHTSLPEGKIMIYRSSTDVHCQKHAPEFSMSLNLLVRPRLGWRPQYGFDAETSCVLSAIGTDISSRATLSDIAAFMANGETVQLLWDIMKGHADPTFRSSALLALHRVRAVNLEEALRHASLDRDEQVFSIVESQLQAANA